jgi:hypothetical protein
VTRPETGRLKAITRLTSVLLPEPLDPTSAVVDPAGARKSMPFSTSCPGLYSNETFSNAISPCTSAQGSRSSSPASSVATRRISRMRSSPAKASLICVPIEAICTTGATTSAMKIMYVKKSPNVISFARIAFPPTIMTTTPITPTIAVEIAVVIDTPDIERRMLSNKRSTLPLKTRSSCGSAT